MIRILFITFVFINVSLVSAKLDNYYALKNQEEVLREAIEEISRDIASMNRYSNHFWKPSSTKTIITKLQTRQRLKIEKIKKIKEQIRLLEEVIRVRAWTKEKGILREVEALLGGVKDNAFCHQNQKIFFTNKASLGSWKMENDNLENKVDYFAEKNVYITECLLRKREDSFASVDEKWTSLCRKTPPPSLHHEAHKAYTLRKKGGRIILTVKLKISFSGTQKNKEMSLRSLDEARSCMGNFFAKAGIKLEIFFQEQNSNATTPKNNLEPELEITLHDHYHRPDSSNWASLRVNGENLTKAERCSFFLHELGHNLGLSDTYPDPDCPDRTPLNPEDDIMNNHWRGPSKTMLYPSAIKKILQPLCEG